MRAPLSNREIKRLILFLGKSGSDYPGERAEGAAQAHRLLQRHNITWEDLLSPYLKTDPARKASWCLKHDDLLTDFERDVLRTVSRSGRAKGKHNRIVGEVYDKIVSAEHGKAAA